jgi:hypothetical protein
MPQTLAGLNGTANGKVFLGTPNSVAVFGMLH